MGGGQRIVVGETRRSEEGAEGDREGKDDTSSLPHFALQDERHPLHVLMPLFARSLQCFCSSQDSKGTWSWMHPKSRGAGGEPRIRI